MLVNQKIAVRLMLEGEDPTEYVYHEKNESRAMAKAVDELVAAIKNRNHTFFNFVDNLDGIEETKAELRKLGYPVFTEGGLGNAVLW